MSRQDGDFPFPKCTICGFWTISSMENTVHQKNEVFHIDIGSIQLLQHSTSEHQACINFDRVKGYASKIISGNRWRL